MTIIPINLDKIKKRPSTAKVYFTYSDIAHLPEYPEGPLVELINGDLYMTPSPTSIHQKISMNISIKLGQFVQSSQCGKVLTAPIDVYFSEEDFVVPDIIFISKEKEVIIEPINIKGSPDLIIEIISTNRKRDYVIKRNLYEKYKVQEYWIVDHKEREVIFYTLKNNAYTEPRSFKEDEEIISKLPDLKEFRISVQDIFTDL